MKGEILVCLLFFFGCCKGFIQASTEEVDRYTVLSNMFTMVFKEMKLQDERLETLEKSTNLKQCKINGDEQDRMTTALTEAQFNTLQDNIEQVKDYLNHISKGLATEKIIRTRNSKAIVKNTENIAINVKNINDNCQDLLQTQREAGENQFKDLETKLKNHEDKIIAHMDKMIEYLTENFTKSLAEHDREQKEEMKKAIQEIEQIQNNVVRTLIHVSSNNLAKGKSAKQSSTIISGKASRATDGNTSGVWSHNSCTHTNLEKNPWWQVDLAGMYAVKKVVIINRSDCCGERLHDIVISVSEEKGINEEICGRFKGPSTNGSTETITCYHPLMGRYLKIQIEGKLSSFLTLCEVKVFSM